MGEHGSACVDAAPSLEAFPAIEPAETAVAAFLGKAAGGPAHPTLVRSWGQFVATFGSGVRDGLLAHAVSGFFANGGTAAYIVRVEPAHAAVPVYRAALAELAGIDEVTIVCAPDAWLEEPDVGVAVQRAVIAHCEQRRDRVAILDAPPRLDAQEALAWRVRAAAHDSEFAVLYYPWLKVFDEASGEAVLVPPCGHLAGVWSRVDASRGVHKAATNELVRGVIGVGCAISRADHERLDAAGVNCVRAFLGRGVRVWGSRTLAGDARWHDITVRRVVCHVESSIRRGTTWLAHRPADEETRTRLVRSVRTFLFQTLLTGALVGESVAQAFRVELVASTDADLVCEIGIAPKRPGEYVTFRLVHGAGAVPQGAD